MRGRSVGVRPWTVAEATLRFDNQDAYPKLAHIALPAPRHYVSSRAPCLRTYGCQTINGGKTRQKPLHPHFTLVCIWAMVGSSECVQRGQIYLSATEKKPITRQQKTISSAAKPLRTDL